MADDHRREQLRRAQARRRAKQRGDEQRVRAVDNGTRDDGRVVELLTRIDDALMTIVDILMTVSAPNSQVVGAASSRGPLKGAPGDDDGRPGNASTIDDAHVMTRDDARVLPSFTARPGMVPRCAGCGHLASNCRCGTGDGCACGRSHPS